ncbi:hypothetical protein LTR91_026918, partial [Friedmanniomyces endolithicus]
PICYSQETAGLLRRNGRGVRLTKVHHILYCGRPRRASLWRSHGQSRGRGSSEDSTGLRSYVRFVRSWSGPL